METKRFLHLIRSRKKSQWRAIVLTFVGLAIVGSIGLLISCAPASFSQDPACTTNCDGSTGAATGGLETVNQTLSGQGGTADILFVDDNSGSMSFEQNNMAAYFSNFITKLDNRKLNYQIGITTTDVSSASNPPRAINQNGYLQDGHLINFANGRSFITNSDSDRVQLFAQNISRPETISCESEIRSTGGHAPWQDCPSSDERGIYAANLAIASGGQGLIRSDAKNLDIVFLGDEDGRSGIYDSDSAFRLTSKDLPQTLLKKIQKNYGSSKQVHFHSIGVDPGSLRTSLDSALGFLTNNVNVGLNNTRMADYFTGGDQACLNAQNNQLPNVAGSFGYLNKLGALLTNGISGSICSGTQMGNLLAKIGDRVDDTTAFTLNCEKPQNFSATATLNGASASVPTYSLSGNQIVFASPLSVKTTVNLTYQCPI